MTHPRAIDNKRCRPIPYGWQESTSGSVDAPGGDPCSRPYKSSPALGHSNVGDDELKLSVQTGGGTFRGLGAGRIEGRAYGRLRTQNLHVLRLFMRRSRARGSESSQVAVFKSTANKSFPSENRFDSLHQVVPCVHFRHKTLCARGKSFLQYISGHLLTDEYDS